MSCVKKFTLGFQPETKAFRVESLRGIIIDELLRAIGNEIPETYYTSIAEGTGGLISLTNKDQSNLLNVDRQNIVLTKSAYENESHVNTDETFKEFSKLFEIIQKTVKFRGIRRIGFVAEHRFDSEKGSSGHLLQMLSKIPNKNNPANFSLHFEARGPVPGQLFDTSKGAFVNCIYDFYDSTMDAQFPTEGKINANFDFQRYYSPSLDTKIWQETEKHFYAFKKELAKFQSDLTDWGLKK